MWFKFITPTLKNTRTYLSIQLLTHLRHTTWSGAGTADTIAPPHVRVNELTVCARARHRHHRRRSRCYRRHRSVVCGGVVCVWLFLGNHNIMEHTLTRQINTLL